MTLSAIPGNLYVGHADCWPPSQRDILLGSPKTVSVDRRYPNKKARDSVLPVASLPLFSPPWGLQIDCRLSFHSPPTEMLQSQPLPSNLDAVGTTQWPTVILGLPPDTHVHCLDWHLYVMKRVTLFSPRVGPPSPRTAEDPIPPLISLEMPDRTGCLTWISDHFASIQFM